MAVILTEANAAFVHIPKCGGSWVENVLRELGIETQHATLPERFGESPLELRHTTPGHLDGFAYSFTFVRHPVTWYESCWSYWKHSSWKQFNPSGWHPWRIIDPCRHRSFRDFVRCVLERQGAYVTRMYAWYIGPPGGEYVNFIGRQENLAGDLTHVLQTLGYTVPDLSSIPHANCSPRDPDPAMLWTDDLKDAVIAAERVAIERFYG